MHSGARNPKWIPSERLHLHEIKSLRISHITCTGPRKAPTLHKCRRTHTSCSQWVCEREQEGEKGGEAESFMRVKANTSGNEQVCEQKRSFSTFFPSVLLYFCTVITKWMLSDVFVWLWECVHLRVCGCACLNSCLVVFFFMLTSQALRHLAIQNENLSRPHSEVNLHRRHTGLTSFSSLPAQMLSISWQGKNTSFINHSKKPQRESQSSA